MKYNLYVIKYDKYYSVILNYFNILRNWSRSDLDKIPKIRNHLTYKYNNSYTLSNKYCIIDSNSNDKAILLGHVLFKINLKKCFDCGFKTCLIIINNIHLFLYLQL